MSKINFNTGRHYGPDGQRIAAMQCPSGEVIFIDKDRGIMGVLTEMSGEMGADTGGAKVFPPLTLEQVKHEVLSRYVDSYAYKSSSLVYQYQNQLIEN